MNKPEGWYPDPSGISQERFWDGQVWTTKTRGSNAPPAGTETNVKPAFSLPRDTTSERLSKISLSELARRDEVLKKDFSLGEKLTQKGALIGMIAAALLLIYGLWATVGSNIVGWYGQKQLQSEYAQSQTLSWDPISMIPASSDTPSEEPTEEPAAPAVPAFNREPMPTLKAAGEATGIIRIPAIGVEQVFVSGTKIPDLKKGPGIWEYGSFPGTPGNATISGHRTTYGGPFRHIDQLKNGDQIIISVDGQPDAVFEVRGSIVVAPSRVQVTEATPGVRLTLTTCEPVGSDAERLVVQAELVSGAWVDHSIPADQWTIMS